MTRMDTPPVRLLRFSITGQTVLIVGGNIIPIESGTERSVAAKLAEIAHDLGYTDDDAYADIRARDLETQARLMEEAKEAF